MTAEPRHAASVILLRPAPAQGPDVTAYETFMVRRPAESAFAPNVYVFPGGTLRADDRRPPDVAAPALAPAEAHRRLGGEPGAGLTTPTESLALWIAALRELFEEAGVLLALGADGALVSFDGAATTARFAAYRNALQAGALSLWDLAAREGLVLAPERLAYWAHWITPLSRPRRFNTRFFLAVLPAGQEALHCAVETTDGLWLSPSTALASHAAREFPLVFVTLAHLRRLAGFLTLEALWSFAETKPVMTVLPREEEGAQPPRFVVPPEVDECW
jgi:8-oxo-dGTP pyrophosphatase MutT (NUDIX family)